MTEVDELKATVSKFRRLLNPVFMELAYNSMAGNEIGDDTVLFSFMGGGGSDCTTVGHFRELMGDERDNGENS